MPKSALSLYPSPYVLSREKFIFPEKKKIPGKNRGFSCFLIIRP